MYYSGFNIGNAQIKIARQGKSLNICLYEAISSEGNISEETGTYANIELQTLGEIQKYLPDFHIVVQDIERVAQKKLSDPIYFGDDNVCSRLKKHKNYAFQSAAIEGKFCANVTRRYYYLLKAIWVCNKVLFLLR